MVAAAAAKRTFSILSRILFSKGTLRIRRGQMFALRKCVLNVRCQNGVKIGAALFPSLLFYLLSVEWAECGTKLMSTSTLFLSSSHFSPLFHRLRCIEWDISRSFLLRLGLTIFSIVLIFTMAQVNAVSKFPAPFDVLKLEMHFYALTLFFHFQKKSIE